MMKQLFSISSASKRLSGAVSVVLLNRAMTVSSSPGAMLVAGTTATHHPAFHNGGMPRRVRTSAAKAGSFGEDDAEQDFEWLKKSRPVRIRAEMVEPNDGGPLHGGAAHDDSKIVHFQRHGQGTHNEAYRLWTEKHGQPLNLSETDPAKNPLLRPDVVDAPLTSRGRDQCAALSASASELRPELVVVSPLVRALQTARLTFAAGNAGAGSRGGDDVPWIAHESLREELGLLLCNKRRPLSRTEAEFPSIDFSLLPRHPDEDDVMWTNHVAGNVDPNGNPIRESMADMSHRSYDFLVDFLRKREEREIAVVGHSAWLYSMCHAVLDCGDDESLLSMFEQAELRSMRLTFHEDDE